TRPSGLPELLSRLDLPEVAVLFLVRPRREVQRVVEAGGVIVAEGETPQSLDHDRALAFLERAAEVPVALVVLAVGVDRAVREVAHQQAAAEPPEVGWRGSDPPRRVQLPVVRDR